MEGAVLYVSISVLMTIVAAVVIFIKYVKSSASQQQVNIAPNDAVPNEAMRAPRRVGAARRPVVRNRLAPAAARHNYDDSNDEISDEDENAEDTSFAFDGKVGKKKQRKLEEKAAKKAQREAEEEERRERREREEKLERKRKREEEQRQKEEAVKAAEEQRLKEEQAQREHEEYLKLKEAFSVDEEGIDAQEEEDIQSLLQEFISYIEQSKVVMLEDLAAHFKIKTQDAIDRVKTLQAEGRLSGVIDDRGKFIYITAAEYESVARYIKQCGRVSISELAESMNRLICLNTDKMLTLDIANVAEANA